MFVIFMISYLPSTVINCVSLPSLTNGMIVYSPDLSEPFSYGTLATFSCNDGFQLDGSNLRTCTGDDSVTIGSWGDPSPACVREWLLHDCYGWALIVHQH